MLPLLWHSWHLPRTWFSPTRVRRFNLIPDWAIFSHRVPRKAVGLIRSPRERQCQRGNCNPLSFSLSLLLALTVAVRLVPISPVDKALYQATPPGWAPDNSPGAINAFKIISWLAGGRGWESPGAPASLGFLIGVLYERDAEIRAIDFFSLYRPHAWGKKGGLN